MEPPERIPRQVRHNPGAEIAKGNARGTAGGTKLHHRLILPGTTPGKGKLPDEQKTTQPPHLAQDCAGAGSLIRFIIIILLSWDSFGGLARFQPCLLSLGWAFL